MAMSVESRLRGALWGFFSGDALASPTHWYYGGFSQVQSDYGRNGIVGYTSPKKNLAGSILNKSNTNGAGRGSFGKNDGISIIGDVINHGKRKYWDPKKSIHYHATLRSGENTLEAQLARVLMRVITENNGQFDPDKFRKSYIQFMTTPGSHNDTYASTCHRMFFANLILNKKTPEECPDNDFHNVDTIDGLVLPTIAALAMSASSSNTAGGIDHKKDTRQVSVSTVGVTRNSRTLESASEVWSDLIFRSIHDGDESDMTEALKEAARKIGMGRDPSSSVRDQMSACYLQQSLPSTLDMMAKYVKTKNGTWKGLLSNANIGGENVHRGSILGAFLGARDGIQGLPEQLIEGLHDRDAIAKEIDAFVEAIMKNRQNKGGVNETCVEGNN